MLPKLSINPDLTLTNLLNRVNQEDVFKTYCLGFKGVNTKFNSEFRKDSNPSCSVYAYKGKLYYKDFGEVAAPVDCVGYVQRKFHTDLPGALQIINRDFNLGLGIGFQSANHTKGVYTIKSKDKLTVDEKKTDIQIEIRKFNKADEAYWGSYGITKSTLALYHVFPISWFSVNGKWFKADSLAYCFHYYKYNGQHLVKIYQPRKKGFGKWISNTNTTVVQGEGILAKKGELLIVTKSLKDVMILRELNYESIAPNSETILLPFSYFEKQIKRFKRKFVLFDYDNGGIAGANRYCDKWGKHLDFIWIPSYLKQKDISDVAKKHGLEFAGRVIHSLIYGQTSEEEDYF